MSLSHLSKLAAEFTCDFSLILQVKNQTLKSWVENNNFFVLLVSAINRITPWSEWRNIFSRCLLPCSKSDSKTLKCPKNYSEIWFLVFTIPWLVYPLSPQNPSIKLIFNYCHDYLLPQCAASLLLFHVFSPCIPGKWNDLETICCYSQVTWQNTFWA